MTIELSILIPIITTVLALAGWYRAEKKENEEQTVSETKVITKLDSIESGVNEIKSELKSVKNEVKDLEHRTTKLETILEIKGVKEH